MQSLYLIGRKEVELENEEKLTLNYCLVEDREEKPKPLYGIKVIQIHDNDYATSEYTHGISYSKSYVTDILKRLIDNNVLVSNLVETVDDLVSINELVSSF